MRLLAFILILAFLYLTFPGVIPALGEDPKGGKSPGASAKTGKSSGTKEEDEDKMSKDSRKELEKAFQDKDKRLDEIIKSKSKISYTYKRMEYNEIEHTYMLWGDVEIKKQDLTFKAQKISYNDWTEEVELVEDVVIMFREDKLTGSRAVYNLRTQTGFIEDARGELEPDVIFEADLLEILPPDTETGKGVYRITDGMFTSCDGDGRVPWRIKCGEATAHKDNYMQLNNSRFEVMNVPVFWMPYWIHPIKPNRSTGFLFPVISNHSILGFHLEPGFFWAINDYFDTTFYLNYYSKFVLEEKTRFRYTAGETSRGIMNLIFRKENVDDINNHRKSDSAGVEFDYNIKQSIPGGFRLMGWGDIFSQELTQHLFYDNIYRQNNQNTISSYLSISRNFGYKDNLQFIMQDIKNFSQNTRTQYLPIIIYTRSSSQLFNPNLRYGISFSASNERNMFEDAPEENMSEIKGNLASSLEYNWNIAPWLILKPIVKYKADYFSLREDASHYRESKIEIEPDDSAFGGTKDVSNGIMRYALNFETSLTGPIVYRNFEGLFPFGVKKLQHKIEPEINFIFKPAFDERYVPGRVDRAKKIEFKITNRLLGKQGKSGVVELISFYFKLGYDFYKTDSAHRLEQLHEENPDYFKEPTSAQKPFDNIILSFRLSSLGKKTRTQCDVEWDPYEQELAESRLTLGSNLEKVFIDLTWKWSKDFTRETYPTRNDLWLRTSIEVSKYFSFNISTIYNKYEDETTQMVDFQCRIMPSCWGINLYIKRWFGDVSRLMDDPTQDLSSVDYWNFGVSFELRNIGTIRAPGMNSFKVE